MHAAVKNSFIAFNEPIEKRVRHMYLDKKGWVTVGVGNLIDPIDDDVLAGKTALDLPFVYKPGEKNAGKPANRADIEAEWKLIKGKKELSKEGYKACAKITKLELLDPEINKFVIAKLEEMENELKLLSAFRDLEQWPADAQLGLLSMSWALGTSKLRGGWVNFKAACAKQNFDTAAKHSHIVDADNPGVIPRNIANLRMFKNAAAVLAGEGKNAAQNFAQRTMLHWPHILMKPITIRG